MRYAIYYTPPETDALTIAAQTWLGRNAFDGKPVAQPLIEGLDQDLLFEQTASPRRYGFHATIVAPFRLADGQSEDGLVESLERFCAGRAPFDVTLAVGRLGSFLALVPEPPSASIHELAADAVGHFAPLRAPLTQAEIERRRPANLSPLQRTYLERWGYPYVMEEFRFHMTLTGSLPADKMAGFEPLLRKRFGPLLQRPVAFDGLAIFAEPAPGEPFTIIDHRPFGETAKNKTA